MEQTIEINKVIMGGLGLGRAADGMAVMVAGVLPGETVTVATTRAHRGHLEARLVRVDTPSPDRITPPCPLSTTCGGCDLQHAAYPAQLRLKQAIVQESLTRARVPLPVGGVEPTLDAPAPFGYRYRLRLHLDADGRPGFHRAGTNEVAPVDRCLLATQRLNQLLARLAERLPASGAADRFSGLELFESPADGTTVLVLHTSLTDPVPAVPPSLADLADQVLVEPTGRAAQAAIAPGAELRQEFEVAGRRYTLTWDHRCFFQVNPVQNERLVALALGLLPPRDQSFPALDLFCGMGNFSVPLGLLGARVTGIEHNPHSLGHAAANCRESGLERSRFLEGDVGHQLRRLTNRGARFAVVLLDPPRQGLGKATALLPELGPEQILSISCDPATHARDLRLLVDRGWHLVRVIPVDLFPQTHHVESVALLERN
jgi:23S rRNA (uracil1939-C5)-methyltransferase